jgi:hypothetical protein
MNANTERLVIASLSLSTAGLVGVLADESYTPISVVPMTGTAGDRPTVGFGSTYKEDGSPVRLCDTITPVAAIKRVQVHLTKDKKQLEKCVSGVLSKIELDVLVDFINQLGNVAKCNSSIVKI